MVHGVSEEFTDCRHSLDHLSRANKITYIKKNPASFQMEEEHRLEGCMRNNVAGSAVICTSARISQTVGYNNFYLSSNREV